jgi:hypothetical protein
MTLCAKCTIISSTALLLNVLASGISDFALVLIPQQYPFGKMAAAGRCWTTVRPSTYPFDVRQVALARSQASTI